MDVTAPVGAHGTFARARPGAHVAPVLHRKVPLADRPPLADAPLASHPSDAAPADATLVVRMAAGDVDALGAFYDRHGAAAYALARALVRVDADAEDVVAQTFAQLWRDAARYDATRGSVAAWVTTLTRSRALDLLRARRRRSSAEERAAAESAVLAGAVAPVGPSGGGPGAAIPLGGSAEAPDAALERGETARAVRASLVALPEPQRRAVVLAFFGGLSHPDVAAALGIPLGTAKTRIRAGLHRLRETLRPFAPEARTPDALAPQSAAAEVDT
jgi:RNA polymerase sigma-70 factor (ECF subfamily)